ncbi:MAG: hypothetical protein GKR89_10090 [Candidatus Latescibacteria bacterium]|nr:hypothetical protein [Candidatus Latescibacterota bacterium]
MFEIIRRDHPRLYRPADEEDFCYPFPRDAARRRILANMVADCELYYPQRPWRQIPLKPHSKHPFHQLYIAFYVGMQATAMMEHYAFVWRLTGDKRWLQQARQWLAAAVQWPHDDRVEEHFYTANRYMQAFALTLDLLDGELSAAEKKDANQCLIKMMRRWWPDVDRARHSTDGAHHAVVDNGHFGVAAIHLLGQHDEAEKWLAGVVDRFRHGIMPHGCDHDGQPGDGPSFWPWENLWMLQFVDALKNVTGIDLAGQFPQRLRRPLTWLRYHLAAPACIEDRLYTRANANMLLGSQLDACSPALLRLAQEAGDGSLRRVALGDPRLGRLYRFGAGVKGSNAECMIAYGPYVYCYCDPAFKAGKSKKAPPLSRKFTQTGYGDTGLLRSKWGQRAVIACISGYKGGTAHGFAHLHVQWSGQPLLRTIGALEAQPVGCGSLPVVGEQNEVVGLLKGLSRSRRWDRLRVDGVRTVQEYWLLRGASPVVLAAIRRRPRGVRVGVEEGVNFVQLNGRDYLQYPRQAYFNPSAGRLRLRFKLRQTVDALRPQILFNTGLLGPQVNNYVLGFYGGKLTFAVQSQRYTRVAVELAGKHVEPGIWHEVAVAWGGFNRNGGRPFIEMELDGDKQRCDDAAVFGELESDSLNLQSRREPRTFYIGSNTVLAFGAAVQQPDSGTACDLADIQLRCPGRKPLYLDFANGLGAETGSGPLGWKLNPVDLRGLGKDRVLLGAGEQTVAVQAWGAGVDWTREEVPYAPAGLAAGSLKSFVPGAEEGATRVQTTTAGDVLVLAFAGAEVPVVRMEQGFTVGTGRDRCVFAVATGGRRVLELG